MSKRLKSNHLLPKSWSEADTCLGELSDLTSQRASLELALKDQIKLLKDQHKESIEEIDAKIQARTLSLAQFCESRRAEFGEARSKKLMHGVVGWRRGNPKVVGVPTKQQEARFEAFLAALRGRNMHDCIRTTPEVDKETLRTYAADRLAELGVSVIQEDEFYSEPSTPSLASAEGAA